MSITWHAELNASDLSDGRRSLGQQIHALQQRLAEIKGIGDAVGENIKVGACMIRRPR